MSYVLAFLGFAALIILHEAGHFVAAKAVGMRVERFSLFFGPLLIKRTIGETEYGVGPIPLGGYVKITGMSPNEDIPPEVLPRAYYNQPVWKRVVTILAGPAVNLVIAFLIVVGILLSQGQPAVTAKGQPIYSRQVVALGPPASSALKLGDTIIAVDGHSGLSVPQITTAIGRHTCAGTPANGCSAAIPVRLTVRRGSTDVTLSIRPRYNANLHRMLVGVDFSPQRVNVAVTAAASKSVSYMWYVTTRTVSTIARIFEPKERRQLHSVVGSYEYTQKSFATSASLALQVLALISLSLGVINLFPFLPLDGGHVFWAVAEKIRGRRIPFSVMERAGIVGFALIIMVFLIGLSNDISTLTGPGFNLR